MERKRKNRKYKGTEKTKIEKKYRKNQGFIPD